MARAYSQFCKFMIYHENIRVLWAAVFLYKCWKHVLWDELHPGESTQVCAAPTMSNV